MVYRIVFTNHASKSLEKIPSDVKERIRTTLLRIQVRPFDFLDKMINHPYYKLRVGDYRIVFDLNIEKQEVYILIIAHRREVYQLVGKRYSFRT